MRVRTGEAQKAVMKYTPPLLASLTSIRLRRATEVRKRNGSDMACRYAISYAKPDLRSVAVPNGT
jgi:hypothetical protein